MFLRKSGSQALQNNRLADAAGSVNEKRSTEPRYQRDEFGKLFARNNLSHVWKAVRARKEIVETLYIESGKNVSTPY